MGKGVCGIGLCFRKPMGQCFREVGCVGTRALIDIKIGGVWV